MCPHNKHRKLEAVATLTHLLFASEGSNMSPLTSSLSAAALTFLSAGSMLGPLLFPLLITISSTPMAEPAAARVRIPSEFRADISNGTHVVNYESPAMRQGARWAPRCGSEIRVRKALTFNVGRLDSSNMLSNTETMEQPHKPHLNMNTKYDVLLDPKPSDTIARNTAAQTKVPSLATVRNGLLVPTRD